MTKKLKRFTSTLVLVIIVAITAIFGYPSFSGFVTELSNEKIEEPDYSVEIQTVLGGVPIGGTALENSLSYSNSDNFLLVYDGRADFTQEEISDAAQSYEHYSDLDYLDRPGPAMASLSFDTLPQSKRTDISKIHPAGWIQKSYSFIDQGYLYNRSHLIAFKLSGENDNVKNLMTGTYWFNHTGMDPFEDIALDSIYTTQGHVLYRVTPIYQGENLIASGVRMEAFSIEDMGESANFDVFVPNKQEHVVIDYKTGDSYSDYKSN